MPRARLSELVAPDRLDVDHRPDSDDPLFPELVEGVFGEGNPAASGVDAEDLVTGGAVEPQPAGDVVVVDDELSDLVVQVGDALDVIGQQGLVPRQGPGLVVVGEIGRNELVEIGEAASVQRRDVGPIDLFESATHRLTLADSPDVAGRPPGDPDGAQGG